MVTQRADGDPELGPHPATDDPLQQQQHLNTTAVSHQTTAASAQPAVVATSEHGCNCAVAMAALRVERDDAVTMSHRFRKVLAAALDMNVTTPAENPALAAQTARLAEENAILKVALINLEPAAQHDTVRERENADCRFKELREKLEAIEKDRDSANAMIARLLRKIHALELQDKEAEDRRRTERKEFDDVKAAKDAQIVQLGSELREMQKTMSELEAMQIQFDEIKAKHGKQLESLYGTIKTQQLRINKLTAEIQRHQDFVEACKADMRLRESAFDDYQKQTQAELDERKAAFKSLSEASEIRICQLQLELRDLKEENRLLQLTNAIH
ncbi:hypothetical protein HK101_001942 [Irineochytrium annulatum]|nr:hypothetical protein HK101_001942 [Irineochytrium annulatum]